MYFVLSCLLLFISGEAVVMASPMGQRSLLQPTFDLTKMETLFSFGDSYTTQYLDLPTMTYPDSDQVSSTNGPNWVHYFTGAANLKDWDLAYNSAPIQNSLVNQNPSVIDVSQQITQLFPKYFLKNNTQQYSHETTLYDIWVGINDLGLILEGKANPEVDTLMSRLEELITFLYDHNTKYIMLINVPPIDRSPMWATKDTAAKMKSMVKEYNQGLEKMAQRVTIGKSLRVFYINAWAIFNEMLDNPDQYGFKNVTGYCSDWHHTEENGCLPIENYFWLNNLHPTTKVHDQLAKAMKEQLESKDVVGL